MRTLRLLLVIIVLGLYPGCAHVRSNCPEFPIPSEYVQEIVDDLGETDREVWDWTNKLAILCEQLKTCEPTDDDGDD